MNRPLIWAAGALAAGILAAGQPGFSLAWVGVCAALLIAIHQLARARPWRDGVMIAAVFFGLGVALEIGQRPGRQGDALSAHARDHPGAIYRIEGRVTQTPVHTPDTTYMAVRLAADRVWASGEPAPAAGGVVLRWSDPARAVHPGERIAVEGRIDPLLGDVNLGTRGIEDFYRTHGVHSTMRVRGDAVRVLSRPRVDPRYWASRLRHWEATVFTRAAPPEVTPFLRAVWLGDRGDYADADYQPFLETGTAHILAVSGVHVGIVYLALQWVLGGVIRSRKRLAAVIILAVFLFALAAGARPPIFRAALMIALYLAADLLDREPDAPSALGIAALLMLVPNPALLGDTGFLLSFSSLASILIYCEPINARLEAVPRGVRENLAAALGVSVLPHPVSAHAFHVIPLAGPVANLLVIPLLGGVLWLCMLTVAAAPFSLGAASLFGHAAAPLVAAINWSARTAAALPLSSIQVTSPTWIACAFFLAGAIGLARWLHGGAHPRRWLGAAGVALLCAWAFWRPIAPPAGLDFLDVGHGDATFIRTPGGTTLLIDAGNETEYIRAGSRTVVPWLLAHGIDALDYLVITHPDQDHIGGAFPVLDRIRVGTVVLWPDPTDDPSEQALIARCAEANIPVLRAGAGDSLPVDGARIGVAHPPRGATYTDINNLALVLHVTWPGMNALLTGDIELEAERALLPSVSPVDILKAPHHGSHTSSGPAFLDATAPRVAIVSTRGSAVREPVGRGVLPRYEERGIRVLRTDHAGGIRMRQHGEELIITTARGQRGYSLAPRARPGK